jgi:hypothetical protein
MITAPTLQPEFLLGEQSTPDMRHAARQMALIQRELSLRNRHVLRTVGRWLDLYEYTKMLEEDHWAAGDRVSEHRQFFMGTISVVKGLGTLLIARLQNDDARQLESLGVSFRYLNACVEELSDLERALNSDLTPEMIAEMNEKLFGREHPV